MSHPDPSIDNPFLDDSPYQVPDFSKRVFVENWPSMSPPVLKPWGHYNDVFRQDCCVFKIITVDPDQRLSLQKHERRGEVWIVLSGRGWAEVYTESILKGLMLERKYLLLPGARVDIKPQEVHRLSAGSEGIVVAELQYGECSEEDIVRLEDDHGRVTK